MPYDADQIANLEALLDALEEPTTAEVLAVADNYDAIIVAASATRRAINAGGGENGGSQADLAQVLAEGDDADGGSIMNLARIVGVHDGSGHDVVILGQPGPEDDFHEAHIHGADAPAGFSGGGILIRAGNGGEDTGDGPGYGGDLNLDGGDAGDVGASGGDATLSGGSQVPEDPDINSPGVVTATGATAGGGTVQISAPGGLYLNGIAFNRAAHVGDGSTVDQLRDALIAAGLMAAS